MTGRWICYILASVLSLSTMAILLVESLFQMQVRPSLEQNRMIQAENLEPFMADVEYLSHEPLLASLLANSHDQLRDAGTVLNEKMHWIPQPLSRPRGLSTPLIPITVRESIQRLREDWMKKHMRTKTIKVDLSLFSDLARFDHWDLEADSPITDLINERIFILPSHLPTPDVSDLLTAVKLRLMFGALRGDADFLPALNDVRRLAQLLLTTENQQLIITGLAALDDERTAYQYFVDERDMEPATWTPVDRMLLRRATRALLGTRGFLHLWTSPSILEKVFIKGPTPMGFCAAVNEAMPLEYGLRHRLEPHLPLEINLKSEYRQLDQIYRRARTECRLRYLGEMTSHDAIHFPEPGPFVLNFIPYSRKVFALRTSVINFHGFPEYANPHK